MKLIFLFKKLSPNALQKSHDRKHLALGVATEYMSPIRKKAHGVLVYLTLGEKREGYERIDRFWHLIEIKKL